MNVASEGVSEPGVLTAGAVGLSAVNFSERGARRRLLRLVVERFERDRDLGVDDIVGDVLWEKVVSCRSMKQ